MKTASLITKAAVFALVAGCYAKTETRLTSHMQAEHKIQIDPFTLDIVTWNHAEQLSDGQMCYHITQDSLVIRRYFMWQTAFEDKRVEDTLIRQTLQNDEGLKQLSRLQLDHLDNFYNNEQVMITSGNEISVRLKRNGSEKKISLHAMTIPEIDTLFSLVNEIVPEKYQLK